MSAWDLDTQGGVNAITAPSSHEWRAGKAVTWVHLDVTATKDRQWLTTHSLLPAQVIHALVAQDTRPRVTVEEHTAYGSFRGVNLNPNSDPEDMVSIRFWTDGQRLITAYRRNLLSLNDVLEALQHGHGPRSVPEFLAMLLDRLTTRMASTVDDLADRVALLETAAIDHPVESMRGELANLRRETIVLRRYLAPQRDAFARLLSEKIPWLDEHSRRTIREASDRLIRHVEDLEAVRERAAVIQEELSSKLSEQLNSRMYVLSVISLFFLPLGFLTGLLGINVAGIPGAEQPWAFTAFVSLLLIVVSGLALWMRWRKWL